MKHHASLFFTLPSATADAIRGAILPETRPGSGPAAEVPKTRGAVATAPGGLVVEVDAEDLPSLRAALNSYLRWVDAAEKAAGLAR